MRRSRSSARNRAFQMLFGLVGGLVALLVTTPAVAQNDIPMQLMHQGQTLPAGTSVVVLERAGERDPTGIIQPVFLRMNEYPRNEAAIAARDTLGTNGRTASSYERTQSSGSLYFLYAQTPDDELYASYSAERDMLKFDVVQTGAMSVAPIREDEVAADVYATFFDPNAFPAVVAADEATPALMQDQPATPPDETADIENEEVAAETENARVEAANSSLNRLSVLLFIICLLLLSSTIFVLMRYRRLREEHENLVITHRALTASGITPRRVRELEDELAVIQKKYETVKHSCQTLLERYDSLSKQLENVRRVTKKSERP